MNKVIPFTLEIAKKYIKVVEDITGRYIRKVAVHIIKNPINPNKWV